MFPRKLFYVNIIYFLKTDIKKSSMRWKLLPGSVSSQNLQDKTFTPKQERKLPTKR